MKITSKDNKSIKLAKKLHTKKERKENNLFLVEGEKLIKEAISSGININSVFYTEGKEINFNLNKGIPLYEIPEHFMEYISTTDSPPPFLAIAEIPLLNKRDTDNSFFILIVNNIQDPGNFGTIIRSSEATGVDFIIASKGTVDVFNPKTVRASMGSVFRLPVLYEENIEKFFSYLKQKNWQIVLTSPYAEKDYYLADYTVKTALVIGNEGQGLNKEFLENYTGVKIPMLGNVESLNTSIAASIILYEIMRQKNIRRNLTLC